MNQDQMISLVRQFIIAAGGGLITHGYFTDTSWTMIATGLATLLVGGGWAIYSRRATGLIESAAAQSNVSKIVTDPTTATNTVSNKIVAL